MSQENYRGFASADPALSLEPGDRSFTLMRDGRQVVSRPTPADPTDGRAWGGMLAELFAASIDASPVLQQSERSALIKGAMVATTRQLDKNSRYADPDEAKDNRFQRDGGGGIGITVERTDDKKILIRAVQEASPAGVAAIYRGLADVLVLDEQDAELAARVEQLGMRAVVVDTIMRDAAARERLARATLDAAGIAA